MIPKVTQFSQICFFVLTVVIAKLLINLKHEKLCKSILATGPFCETTSGFEMTDDEEGVITAEPDSKCGNFVLLTELKFKTSQSLGSSS